MMVPGSVEHLDDNRSGQGDGDDEQANVKLTGLTWYKKLVFTIGKEIARYDLSEDDSTETAMIFGEWYRYGDKLKFKAMG